MPIVPYDDLRVSAGDRVFVMSMPDALSRVKKLFVV